MNDLSTRVRALAEGKRPPTETEECFAELVDAHREWMDGRVRSNERLSRAWDSAYRLRPREASRAAATQATDPHSENPPPRPRT